MRIAGQRMLLLGPEEVAGIRIFSGFVNSKRNHLFYKTMDARPLLLLAMIGQFPDDGKNNVIVRRHICDCKFCLNPSHYYYGTKADVRLETNQRNGDDASTPRTC